MTSRSTSSSAKRSIYVDPNSPVHVVSNAVFGESRMPDDNQVVFGTLNYRTAAASSAADNNEGVIDVRTNVVFGSIRIRARAGAASAASGRPGSNRHARGERPELTTMMKISEIAGYRRAKPAQAGLMDEPPPHG